MAAEQRTVEDPDMLEVAGAPMEDVITRVVTLVGGSPLLTPENAYRPPPAVMLYLFDSYCRTLEEDGPELPPLTGRALEEDFDAWCQRRLGEGVGTGVDAGQVYAFRYRDAASKTGTRVTSKALDKQWRADLVRTLLVSVELPAKKGTVYQRRFHPAVARLCFGGLSLRINAAVEKGAKKCWNWLCDLNRLAPIMRRLLEAKAHLVTHAGHIPPEAIWRTETVLGRGQQVVYRATDLRDGAGGRQLACKEFNIITSLLDATLLLLQPVRLELSMLYQLQHAHPHAPICYPLGHSVEETGPFEYRVRIYFPVFPGSVANLLTDMRGRMPQDAIRIITLRLLQALVVLQSGEQKYALRDLKLANVLYSGDPWGAEGRIVLCDLGSAVPLPVDGTAGWKGTAGHRAMGTPLYSSPEAQREQWSECGRHSDTWSLGCCVLELCGNRIPSEWAQLQSMENSQISQLVQNQLATLSDAVHPAVRAVLENSLIADWRGRKLAGDLLALMEAHGQ